MSDQANVLRGLMDRRQTSASEPAAPTANVARTIAITSGKGGVGKSNLSLNLAIALSRLGSSVCLLDANLGLGNIDLLCGLNGYWNLSHVVTGSRSIQEICLDGPAGITVVPGASGIIDMADCPLSAQDEILRQARELEEKHDFVVIDTGTGIHRSVRHFAAAADTVVAVTTPEPTSIADAYATIKALSTCRIPLIQALVNRADSASQAKLILSRLQQTSRMFLKLKVESAGYIPNDPSVATAVIRRRPFLLENPQSPASREVVRLARQLKGQMTSQVNQRDFFFTRLWNRLLPKAA